jgi:acetolactate synthase-1/3 small subunit
MKHVLSVMVENKVGVLAHIAGLFSARGFNIDSLTVAETDDPQYSRITMTVAGDDRVIEQVRKQLEKIIDVIKVTDFAGQDYIERDLMLLKVNVAPGKRGEILELVQVFRAKVVDVSAKDMVVEVAGPERKIEAFLSLVRPYGIREVVRAGRVGMLRGAR